MWEVVGRQGTVACYSKCQRNWFRGKVYLIFPGKIDKQRWGKKENSRQCNGAEALEVAFGSLFSSGRSTDS